VNFAANIAEYQQQATEFICKKSRAHSGDKIVILHKYDYGLFTPTQDQTQ